MGFVVYTVTMGADHVCRAF